MLPGFFWKFQMLRFSSHCNVKFSWWRISWRRALWKVLIHVAVIMGEAGGGNPDENTVRRLLGPIFLIFVHIFYSNTIFEQKFLQYKLWTKITSSMVRKLQYLLKGGQREKEGKRGEREEGKKKKVRKWRGKGKGKGKDRGKKRLRISEFIV